MVACLEDGFLFLLETIERFTHLVAVLQQHTGHQSLGLGIANPFFYLWMFFVKVSLGVLAVRAWVWLLV